MEDRIVTAGQRLEKIANRLGAMGYRFKQQAAVFPGPEPGTEAAIERIEREIGPLPLAIKIFWREVGSIDFTGNHSQWKGCEYPDPIVVYPPSYAVDELDQFLEDREERLRCEFPFIIPIAPDAKHKENVSGWGCYNLSMPAVADDPPLDDEPHATTCVNYLELAVGWPGFPGLDKCRDHNWPLAQIVSPRTPGV